MIHPFFGSAPTRGAKTAGQEFEGILSYIPGKGKVRGREVGLGRPLREQRDEKRTHRTQTNDGSEQDASQEKECHSQPCGQEKGSRCPQSWVGYGFLPGDGHTAMLMAVK